MNAISLGLALILGLFASQARADIQVRLSVKFIHNNPSGTAPSGNVATPAGFNTELTRGNPILDATGRGYSMVVVEYVNIQPPAPAGQAANYWFALDARSNRPTIEAAALANQATWAWNPNAVNIYINNTNSGQCSFVGGGSSISLGGTIAPGTVLHELGHLFNLSHTHAGDYNDNTNPPSGVFTINDLQDGDALDETLIDNPNIVTRDQLCVARYGHTYNSPAADDNERRDVDSSFQNVMSYHNEDVLLPVQMNLWTLNANGARYPFVSGKTWFLETGGNDNASGANSGAPLRTISGGSARVSNANDILLLYTGSYIAPPGGTLATPCTLRATNGAVTVHYP